MVILDQLHPLCAHVERSECRQLVHLSEPFGMITSYSDWGFVLTAMDTAVSAVSVRLAFCGQCI